MDAKIEKNSNTAQERIKPVTQAVADSWSQLIWKYNVSQQSIMEATGLTRPTVARALDKKEATYTTQWAITKHLAQVEKEAKEEERKQLEAMNVTIIPETDTDDGDTDKA